ERLEQAIDAHTDRLPRLTAFILPGGSPAGAVLHLGRTGCRPAERAGVGPARQGGGGPPGLRFPNRLSGPVFLLARPPNPTDGRPSRGGGRRIRGEPAAAARPRRVAAPRPAARRGRLARGAARAAERPVPGRRAPAQGAAARGRDPAAGVRAARQRAERELSA